MLFFTLKQYLFKLFPFLDQKRHFREFIKFCIVGGTCAVLNFAIYYSFTEWFGFWYLVSGAVAFIVTATINFLANKFWTFGNTLKGWAAFGQLKKFIVVMISGVIINSSILYFVTDYFGLDYRLSWVFATGLVTFWNYTLNRGWTFRAS